MHTEANTKELSESQVRGIRECSLTREQVDNDWFHYIHIVAHKEGYPYDVYKGLDYHQTTGLLDGLTRKQVEGLSCSQIKLVKKLNLQPASTAKDLKDEVYQGLNDHQVAGILIGLTRDQVNHSWFGHIHIRAHQAGYPYKVYKELNPYQITGIGLGLTRDKVNHGWFSRIHILAHQAGHLYEDYQGLTDPQTTAILKDGLARKQVEGLDHSQIEVVKAYNLPHASIVKGLSGRALEEAALEFDQRRTEKTAWVSVFHNTESKSKPKGAAELAAAEAESGSLTEPDASAGTTVSPIADTETKKGLPKLPDNLVESSS